MTEPREGRDWVKEFGPSLLAVVVSLAIQISATAWYFGSLSNRVSNLEDQQKIISASQVTKEDIKSRETMQVLDKQALDIRLNRMDDKLDRIIESQKRGQ